MLPPDPTVVIHSSDCQAVVTRYRPRPDGSITFECACNADELEADAIAVITAQSTPFTAGTPVPCPPELAARAVWPGTPAQTDASYPIAVGAAFPSKREIELAIGPRIVVITDDDAAQEPLGDLLPHGGYDVLTRSRSSLQMPELAQLAPDLIIFDWVMGEEEQGWLAFKWVTYYPPTEAIPLLICAAATERLQQVEGFLREHGVVVVYKPFAPTELEAAITVALYTEAELTAREVGGN